ncbi:MAG: calcium/sodium antiporter [Mariprofundaceae bacterium]|nr:calcium/sodium antiporter [Mariprofundaceae bacterium]
MFIESLTLITGIGLLVWGADKFVDGSVSIARNLRIPPMVIGLTIVSLGTSLPEMIVAGVAAYNGNRDLGIGNVVGSNIANIGLVLAITALVCPLVVRSMTLKREVPILFLVTAFAFALLADGELSRMDGVCLLLALVTFLIWVTKVAMSNRHDPMVEELTESMADEMPINTSIVWFLVGLTVLFISSKMVVWGSVEIARFFGVSDLIIGLTIVAIGTSLPELVASVTSALKNEADLAVGNVIGSNIFNLLLVLAMPGLIYPGVFAPEALLRDFPIMIAFTIALLFVSLKFKSEGRIGGLGGFLLLMAFSSYLYLLYLQSGAAS